MSRSDGGIAAGAEYWATPPNLNALSSRELLALPERAFLEYMTASRAFRETAYGVAAARMMRWPRPEPAHAKALDWGCGVGYDSVSLAEIGWKVDRTDLIGESVLVADRWLALLDFYPPQVRRHRVDNDVELEIRVPSRPCGFHPPLPIPWTYDLIVAYGVLHHIENPAPVIDAFREALEPNGRVLLMLYTRKFVPEPNARVDGKREDDYTRGYSEDEPRTLFGDGWAVRTGPVWNRGRYMRVEAWRP